MFCVKTDGYDDTIHGRMVDGSRTTTFSEVREVYLTSINNRKGPDQSRISRGHACITSSYDKEGGYVKF